MRVPEKTVRPVPRMPGLMSFKGKKTVCETCFGGQRPEREPPAGGNGAQSYCTRAWFTTLTDGWG